VLSRGQERHGTRNTGPVGNDGDVGGFQVDQEDAVNIDLAGTAHAAHRQGDRIEIRGRRHHAKMSG
jgi:hypothetical protein